MKRIIAAIMVFILIMTLAGCSKYYNSCLGCIVKEPSEDRKNWDVEKSIPIAQSYLEEKYGEEFIYVSRSVPSYAYTNSLVVVCDFIRKDDEEVEEPMKYQVDVVYESGEYTVVGDNYMFVYIRKITEDFLRPYVQNRFSDIEFVFFLNRTKTPCGALDGEYFANAKIPRSFDELYDVTQGIYFRIIVPISENQNKVSEACSLLKSDLEELDMKIEIGGFIDVYQNDHFAEISKSTDPRRDAAGSYSREKIM